MQVIRMGIPFSSYEVLIRQFGCWPQKTKRAALYRTCSYGWIAHFHFPPSIAKCKRKNKSRQCYPHIDWISKTFDLYV